MCEAGRVASRLRWIVITSVSPASGIVTVATDGISSGWPCSPFTVSSRQITRPAGRSARLLAGRPSFSSIRRRAGRPRGRAGRRRRGARRHAAVAARGRGLRAAGVAADPVAELRSRVGSAGCPPSRSRRRQVLRPVTKQEGRDRDQADHQREDAADEGVAQHPRAARRAAAPRRCAGAGGRCRRRPRRSADRPIVGVEEPSATVRLFDRARGGRTARRGGSRSAASRSSGGSVRRMTARSGGGSRIGGRRLAAARRAAAAAGAGLRDGAGRSPAGTGVDGRAGPP